MPLQLFVSGLADSLTAACVVRKWGRDAGLAAKVCGEVAIIAGELASNLVRHGGGGKLFARIDGAYFELRSEDRGPGLADPDQLGREPEPRSPTGPLRPLNAGLGEGGAAIRRLSDEVSVRNREGGGLEIVVRKRIGTGEPCVR